MHGKGATGWLRSYLGGLWLLFRNTDNHRTWVSLLLIHTRLHLLHAVRAVRGRGASPVSFTRLLSYRVEAPSSDLLAFLFQAIFLRRDYEFACKKRNPVIIDCGSNIGLSVLWFKRRYPAARIMAFEPSPRAFDYLERNVLANGLTDVELQCSAVGRETGERCFYTDADDAGCLGASLTTRLTETVGRTVRQETIPCVALSSVIKGPVDILKIDVEGSEQEVLSDLAEHGVLRKVSEIFVEYHFNSCNPTNRLADILALLEDAGMECVVDSKRPPPYPRHRDRPYKCNIYGFQRESADAAEA